MTAQPTIKQIRSFMEKQNRRMETVTAHARRDAISAGFSWDIMPLPDTPAANQFVWRLWHGTLRLDNGKWSYTPAHPERPMGKTPK